MQKVILRLLIGLSCFFYVNLSKAEVDLNTIVVAVPLPNPVKSLTRRQIIDIYMGRYDTFPNGEPAFPIDYPSGSKIKQQFYLKLVNLPETKIRSYWSRLHFSGRARPPYSIDSRDELFKIIKLKPNSLFYLPKSDVTEEMKIVFSFK
ncbi:hypothetical protein [Gayadomonas joobiniege]|uniref:hypothetical protein n=1 Tax=Gayadomonas joobiniege TaxID=1234606 RepID=UPI000366FB76|nr:hypothetical protein [Gayadomonas joobiniege]